MLILKMSTTDWIQFWLAIGTGILAIISTIAIIITIIQNKKINFETSKAQIVFYIDYNISTGMYYLILKNFGNSLGKLISMTITPNLDWKITKFNQDFNPLTNSKDVLLAPNQKISSWFDFEDYPDKVFKIHLEYETLGKIQKEDYQIDLTYINNLDWLTSYAMDDHSNDYKNVLYKIDNSIKDLSDKFR